MLRVVWNFKFFVNILDNFFAQFDTLNRSLKRSSGIFGHGNSVSVGVAGVFPSWLVRDVLAGNNEGFRALKYTIVGCWGIRVLVESQAKDTSKKVVESLQKLLIPRERGKKLLAGKNHFGTKKAASIQLNQINRQRTYYAHGNQISR